MQASAMPRFFFDFVDLPQDETGSELPSLEAAAAGAREALLRTAADDGLLRAAVSVRDGTGQKVLSVSLSVEVCREEGYACSITDNRGLGAGI
jgi:hypothetical protein